MQKYAPLYQEKKNLLVSIAKQEHTSSSSGWKHLTTFNNAAPNSHGNNFEKIVLYSKRIETSDSIDCCVGIMEIDGASASTAAHVLWTRAKVCTNSYFFSHMY